MKNPSQTTHLEYTEIVTAKEGEDYETAVYFKDGESRDRVSTLKSKTLQQALKVHNDMVEELRETEKENL